MTVVYCDLCGKSLVKGDSGIRVSISEYKADVCEQCAKSLIAFVKSGPWKSGSQGVSGAPSV